MAHIIHLSLLLGLHFSIMVWCHQQNGFHFHSEPKIWIKAREHCQGNGSSLVEIREQAIQENVNLFLKEHVKNMPDGAWIGLERTIFGCQPYWMWTSNWSKVGFTKWNESHPVDKSNNHCGKIIRVEGSEIKFKWLDAKCRAELPFICQSGLPVECAPPPVN